MVINSITKMGLDESALNKNVIGQIAKDKDNIFISRKTKDLMTAFIEDKTKEKKPAIALWKNLLIDAVCLLKMNDNREKLHSAFKKIYNPEEKEKFCDAFDEVRLMSSYGIDELNNYFKDFVDFESVLYGTNKHYRDHVLHLLQVWAIGIGLLANNEAALKLADNYAYADKDFSFLICIDEEKAKSKLISKSEVWAIWTIIALCHDLGYPIEKASQVNQQTRKIVNHFGCLNFQELNYSFEIFNGYLVEKFLNIISSKAVIADKDKGNRTVIQSKYHDKFSKSLEEFKHGMFSGLLIFKKLTYFLETDYYHENSELSYEDLRQFFIRKEILRAICGHTCPKIYHINLNTLPFLLILSDEIQEWGRPNFHDLQLRVVENAPNVEIIVGSLEKQEFHIHFKYEATIDKDEQKDEKYRYLVIERFKTLHYLLRSAKDDKERNIDFQWEIEFDNASYRFNFLADSNKPDILNEITIKKAIEKKGKSWSFDHELKLYEEEKKED